MTRNASKEAVHSGELIFLVLSLNQRNLLHKEKFTRVGLEPKTSGLQYQCSTNRVDHLA